MKKTLLLLLMLLPMLSFADTTKKFEIKEGKFLLNGEPTQLICGEMHYPRIPKEYWEDRIIRAKAMGLNTISAYVFWSVHEPKKGQFNFSGQADIAEFVRLAAKHDMLVLLRPGPYVCAEWDYGGYPSWIMQEDLTIRSRDPKFIELCARYLKKLGEQLAPMSINNGGNIVMVQVENEYGSYSDDKVYLNALKQAIIDAGFNAPLMTCDGGGQIAAGHIPGILPTVNGVVGEDIMAFVDKYQKGGPYFVAEFYPAWFDVWGKRHSKVNLKTPAAQLDWMLAHNVSVSLYMFHGGTNFAYTNGANNSNGYEPQPTSYDYDAPLGEWGNAYPKYHAFREVIQKYTKKPLIDVPADNPRMAVNDIKLTGSAPLKSVFSGSVKSDSLLTMEEMGQDYGYIHYQTTINEGGELILRDLRDYAVILLDGKQIGSLDRRYLQNRITIPTITKPATLEILVENVGRVNYGPELLRNRKGITDKAIINGKELRGWTITPLPIYNETFKKVRFGKEIKGVPAFHKGEFTVDSLGDTFLDVSKLCKGAVWINGRSIGKYWSVGPQQTLYVPAPWLKKGKNEIVIFEMEPTEVRSLHSSIEPILDSLGLDKCKPEAPVRAAKKAPTLDKDDMSLSIELKNDNEWQEFKMDKPATMRHICLQFTAPVNKDDVNATLREVELIDQDGKQIDKSRWSIFYVSSENIDRNKGIAENAIDGDQSTLWLSDINKSDVAAGGYPHCLIIDIGEIKQISAVRLLCRFGPPWIPGQVKTINVYTRPQFFL